MKDKNKQKVKDMKKTYKYEKQETSDTKLNKSEFISQAKDLAMSMLKVGKSFAS